MPEQVNSARPSQSIATILEEYGRTAGTPDSSLPPFFGHGTMVAGLVHAMAPTARIMPLTAFNGNGTSTLFDIVRAVYYAADNGAAVLNMSFTMTSYSRELDRAISYALKRGVLLAAAVGNDGLKVTPFPAAHRNVKAVAATTLTDERALFTNYGEATTLAAPGATVVTTFPGGRYAAVSGTSFSTPFVTATIAILRDLKPGIAERDVDAALGTAKDLPNHWRLGYGRLDVLNAATYAYTGRERRQRRFSGGWRIIASLPWRCGASPTE